MGMVHLTSRAFGSLNVKADWRKIDNIVEDIVSKDKNNEVDAIGFAKGEVYNGELIDGATILAIGKDFASFELYKAVNNTDVLFEREETLPSDFIELWIRKQ